MVVVWRGYRVLQREPLFARHGAVEMARPGDTRWRRTLRRRLDHPVDEIIPRPTMSLTAGIDIGGTRIKAGAFDDTGRLLTSALTSGEALCGDGWKQSVR